MAHSFFSRHCLSVILLALSMNMAAPLCSHANEAAPADEGQAAAEGEGEKAALPVAPDYMPMPLLNISILKKNRVVGNLMITMVLDVASDETMQAIDAKRTQLSASYTEALSLWAGKFQNVRAPANVIAIKNQLQAVTDRVLGRNDAIVLLQGAMLTR